MKLVEAQAELTKHNANSAVILRGVMDILDHKILGHVQLSLSDEHKKTLQTAREYLKKQADVNNMLLDAYSAQSK